MNKRISIKTCYRKATKTVYLFVMLFCLIVSLVVFLNSYEIVLGKDSNVKYVDALSQIRINKIVGSLVRQDEVEYLLVKMHQKEYLGNLGVPETLKIPRVGVRLPLSKGMKQESSGWLARSNGAHYLIFGEAQSGNIGDVLIYSRKNWRTVSNPSNIKVGDNIFLDTVNEWRCMFRITELVKVRSDEGYVLSESQDGNLLFVVEDSSSSVNYVYKADFINIQNIQR